jgi:hypothetical protein
VPALLQGFFVINKILDVAHASEILSLAPAVVEHALYSDPDWAGSSFLEDLIVKLVDQVRMARHFSFNLSHGQQPAEILGLCRLCLSVKLSSRQKICM